MFFFCFFFRCIGLLFILLRLKGLGPIYVINVVHWVRPNSMRNFFKRVQQVQSRLRLAASVFSFFPPEKNAGTSNSSLYLSHVTQVALITILPRMIPTRYQGSFLLSLEDRCCARSGHNKHFLRLLRSPQSVLFSGFIDYFENEMASFYKKKETHDTAFSRPKSRAGRHL